MNILEEQALTEQKKRNIKVIWIVVICGAIAAACILLYSLVMNKQTSSDLSHPSASSSISTSPAATSKNELADISITSNSYDVYKPEDLDFGFIVADLHIATTKIVNIPLSSFTTSEGISLDEIDSYVTSLQEHSYSLTSINIASALNAQGSGFNAKVFIPIKDKSLSSIKVTCNFSTRNDLSYDLTNADTAADNLKIKQTAAPTENSGMQITVDTGIEIETESVLTDDDQVYFLPSTARVFAFHVNVSVPSDSNISINSGVFTANDYGTVNCESNKIHTDKCASIIGRNISGSGDGYLFVVILDPGHSITSLSGQMSLQMSDASQNVTVNVSLQ